MLTRRAVLTGTAAASIAAIAGTRGVAAAAPASQGFNLDFGNLTDGAIGAFNKQRDAFAVFLKWSTGGAEVFYKESPSGGVEVFFKTFLDGWSSVESQFLKFLPTLDGAEGSFQKIYAAGAEFFIKSDRGVVLTTFDAGVEGVQVDIQELTPDTTDIGERGDNRDAGRSIYASACVRRRARLPFGPIAIESRSLRSDAREITDRGRDGVRAGAGLRRPRHHAGPEQGGGGDL